MLNVQLSVLTPPELREAITTLRRAHVSRFPIDVVSTDERPNLVAFTDSRFPIPTDRPHIRRCVVMVNCEEFDDKNRRVYMVISQRIENEKYASHNHRHHTKETTDPKKLVKMLKEYVRPYTPMEIFDRNLETSTSDDAELWKDAPRDKFREIAGKLTTSDIAEEIMYLQSLGVQFRSDKFQRVALEGIELYSEAKRRASLKREHVLVYIQPDNSVQIIAKQARHMPEGSWTYEAFEKAPQCVQQQVAMLRMCDHMEFVPEVGRKTRDNMFWILVNPDDFSSTNS